MAIARFKDLCLDAGDPAGLGQFWAAALGLAWESQDSGDAVLKGPTPRHTVWVNQVPEAKAVKHRVHLDVYARELADLEALGATTVEPQRAWTIMADPEGGEFCAFLSPDPPAQRLRSLVVDSFDPKAQAQWWGQIYGTDVTEHDSWFALDVMPGVTMDFDPVPEPKAVKNRIHWDVTLPDVAPLIEAGAVLLREPGGDIAWYVLADPEGNEFCAFTAARHHIA